MDTQHAPVDLDGSPPAPANPPPQAHNDVRKRPTVLAPPEKTTQLLSWIDAARAVNWPVERNLLILMSLLGGLAMFARGCGFLEATR